MESREIEIFLTLAEELHFARTAERLLVSQARVSQTIKKLERRFGIALFERTSRRVALTPVGRRLRDDIGPAFVRIQEGIARATEAGRGVAGPLHVGFSGALQGDLVLSVQAALRVGNPECEVRLHEVPEGDPYGPLRSGEADVAIVRFPVSEPDLTAGPVLISDAVMLAVPARHRLARRDAVGEGDLAGESVLPAGSLQETLARVGAGHGVYPVPSQTAVYQTRPTVAFVSYPDAPPVEFGAVWRTAADNARIRAFVAAAAALVRTEGGPAQVCGACRADAISPVPR
ncbi:LysR family transcriptional regulator [Streptomyces roseoverticillatus]|uniref:LysR family transcriptional regulator n=1 Tax=Streptomyces roseoverticillatus TaxID=66429 RepID=UPI0006943829|nr:LysR substrate-binding domain-containing protein [Streptomyces roseoverticillatus]